MARVDGVVLVVRYGVTRRRSLLRAKAQLDKVGARLIGVIVNGLSARETRRQYAEYTHYVGAAKAGKRKKRKA
jgi:Mrp family chromosome partitioning ATPase